MATDPLRAGTPPDRHAAALEAARRRLALMKAGTLGAGVLAFGVLTAGIAGSTGAIASSSGNGSTQSAGQPLTQGDSQPGIVVPDSGGGSSDPNANANPGGGGTPLNPPPPVVSAQS